MAKKIKPTPAAAPVAAVVSHAPGFWGATLIPLLKRRGLVIAVALIAIATLRIALDWSNVSLTWDEPGHMACGLQYLAQHVYRYEAQHPPLARMAGALGPFLDGARPLGIQNQDQEGVAVIYRSGHPGREVSLMRAGMLPFFVLAALSVFLWARRYFGGPTAVLATLLFTLTPTVLAHAGVATTDMPLAACLTAAFLLLLIWAEEPSTGHSLLLGLMVAMAVTSKFTALGFFPAAALLAAIAWIVVARPGVSGIVEPVKVRAVPLAIAVLTGAVAIWAVYLFRIGPVIGWGISLPAPELFEGVGFAMWHNSKGRAAYLLGEVRDTGWWYFFPVLLAVKTPLGLLALAALGLGVGWARRMQVAYWMPAAFALGILIPAMTSHVNIGLRHILPIFSAISILGGAGLMRLIERASAAKWAGPLATILVAWIAVSGVLAHPDYLAYFNELAGDSPEGIVVDSDLDWGQNTIRLARRLKELGATQVAFTDFNLAPAQLQVWPGLPPTQGINPLVPEEGWTAVSPSIWMLRRYGMSFRDPRQPWFAYIRPQEKVGSLWLYYVAPRSLNGTR